MKITIHSLLKEMAQNHIPPFDYTAAVPWRGKQKINIYIALHVHLMLLSFVTLISRYLKEKTYLSIILGIHVSFRAEF